MHKISLAIATYNEEENIVKCLKSVSDLVSEIIAVDGGSTDRTVEILKKYDAKVTVTDNPPIFHINKQKAIDKCGGDWILQLDADEVVTEELKREIQQVIKKSEIDGYWIPRSNFFLGKFLKKGGQYPDYTLRLYRRGKGRLPCKSVHEQAEVEGKTAYLEHDLLHYPYPDFTHYLEHFNRYTEIFARELKVEKVNINFSSIFKYCVIKPKLWFLSTYFRHKGFQDGFPGFVFSLFSALRFPAAFIKYWEKAKNPVPTKSGLKK